MAATTDVLVAAFRVRDGPRNLEGHFGSDTGACPDVEGGADSSCALLHAANPPVPGPSASFEQGWIDSAAVVTNPHTEVGVTIGQFDLDHSGVRRSKGIDDRFSCDPVHFVAHDRVQRSGAAFREDTHLRLRARFHLCREA
jgi:hypothetical protein